MSRKIIHIALLLASIGLAHAAQSSNFPTIPMTLNVTVPEQQGAWQIGLEAALAKRANSDLHYAISTDAINISTNTTTQHKTHTVDPHADWAGRFDITYLFADLPYDITLAYRGLDKTESGHLLLNNFPSGTLFNAIHFEQHPIFSPSGAYFVTGWETVDAKSENKYDALDLTFGQQTAFGTNVNLHPFAGLRWAYIKTMDKAFFTAVGFDDVAIHDEATLTINDHYRGIGPRGGIDGSFRVHPHIEIVGRIAGSLLVGDLHQDFSIEELNQGTFQQNVTSLSTLDHGISDETRVVPELDARLGIRFMYKFYQRSIINLEIGYDVENYVDVDSNSLTNYVDAASHHSDFANYGPYFRVEIKFS